jgi:hypothetical protein
VSTFAKSAASAPILQPDPPTETTTLAVAAAGSARVYIAEFIYVPNAFNCLEVVRLIAVPFQVTPVTRQVLVCHESATTSTCLLPPALVKLTVGAAPVAKFLVFKVIVDDEADMFLLTEAIFPVIFTDEVGLLVLLTLNPLPLVRALALMFRAVPVVSELPVTWTMFPVVWVPEKLAVVPLVVLDDAADKVAVVLVALELVSVRALPAVWVLSTLTVPF